MDVPIRALHREPCHPASVVLDRPRLSVILVNYLRWDDTARLVRQLRGGDALRDGRAEVVIVDNHSPRHPVVPRLSRTPNVSLVRWRANRGFARAVNEGARLARGDWLLLLNPDMTAQPDFLDVVLHRADALARTHPDAGIVGFRLIHGDGSPQMSTGHFPTLGSSVTRLLLPRRIRKYTHPEGEGPRRVDWVTGCCLLARRDCWADLGGLDPAFFLYYEDVDLCRRAPARGWSVWYDPGASLVHHRPLHARQVPPHLRLVTRHALLTYASKHWGPAERAVLNGIIRVEAAARRMSAWLKGDREATDTFGELGHIAADLGVGRLKEARARLVRVVRRQERRDVHPVDRHPEPQPTLPAARLPDERHAPLSAWHGMAGR